MTPPVALTIAGSDSGGGAGLQADLATFAARGVFGTSAVTMITAANTSTISDTVCVPASTLSAQINAVLDDFPVAAVKCGALGTAENARAVLEFARAGRLPNLVVDTVLVSTSGTALVEESAYDAYRALAGLTEVSTPNVREQEILSLSGPLVVVTGGDSAADESIDVVFENGVETAELGGPAIQTANTHGTGCVFSAAVCAELAKGASALAAVETAKAYLANALRSAQDWVLGGGTGPFASGPLINPPSEPR